MAERRTERLFPALRAEPRRSGLVHSIERRDLNQNIGSGRKMPVNKFEIAKRSEK